MSILLGVLFAVIAGAFDGSWGVVMKATKKWEYENIWMLFSITGMALIPPILAACLVPDLVGVYRAVSAGVLLRTFLLGAGWGVGCICFGLGLYMLGQSFAYTVMMGIIAVGGSLIPMLVTNPATALTTGGVIIILSMLVAVVGVASCGKAGKLRDAGLQESPQPTSRRHSFALAFLVCLAAGFLSCMFNWAFHFAQPITEAATAQLGAASTNFRANSPRWALATLGGFVPNVLYCFYVLTSKNTWKNFLLPGTGRYWLYGVFMAAVWVSGITSYGVGASYLGKLGTTVGWLCTIAVGILAANSWGIITGEWKGAPNRARQHMLWGSVILFGSILLVNYGNYLLSLALTPG